MAFREIIGNLKGGSSATHVAPAGTIQVDTATGSISVHDGSTPGGSASTPAAVRIVTSNSTNVGSGDSCLVVRKPSGSPTTINLPAKYPLTQTLVVKDGKGDAATNSITLHAPNGSTIDGQATFIISVNYMAASLVFDGTYWNLV